MYCKSKYKYKEIKFCNREIIPTFEINVFRMNSPSEEILIYSLSDLAEGIRFAIYRSFPGQVWVQAEIAKLNIYPRSGHVYLDLVEKEDGATKSQMRGIIWANDFPAIRKRFEDVTRESFAEGLMILFLARINFHEVYGFSLWISDVEPSYTLGELTRAKEQTIERLKKEKVFDLNRQLSIAIAPLRIAVISAETSKGYLDFINVIKNHPAPYRFQLTLFPALLQGDKAIESIRNQLFKVSGSRFEGQASSIQHPASSNEHRATSIEHPASSFDLLAIIRGGGDEIGLTCFNDYYMARDICRFRIPVITGIGHSTNETVVELVASLNKITPTEVAYYLLARLDKTVNELDDLNLQIDEMIREILAIEKGQIARLSEVLVRESHSFIHFHKQELEHSGANLSLHLHHFLSLRANRLDQLEQQVRGLDPKTVLRRGFSLTYNQRGNIIRDSGAVSAGDKIKTELHSGTIQSTIDP